jgi:hypothetical protein
MNFTKIELNTPPKCNCLDKAVVITDVEFARHIYMPKARPQDFFSKWEKYENTNSFPINFNYNNCRNVCGTKGVSIHLWKNESKERIINEYVKNFQITRKAKNSILIFKLKLGAGVIAHTPKTSEPTNPFHHDFYKSDDFSIDLVDNIEIISLKDLLQDDE